MPRGGLGDFGAVMAERTIGPPDSTFHGSAGSFVADGPGRAFIEHHHDVAAERKLDVDCRGRSEYMGVAVEVRLESHAFFGDAAEVGQAEDLEAAGIGEDGAGPRHEFVQASEVADEFVAGAKKKMVGIGEDDGCFEVFPQIALAEAFHGGLCSDWHEGWGGDVAVLGVKNAGAGMCYGAFGEEFKGNLAGQVFSLGVGGGMNHQGLVQLERIEVEDSGLLVENIFPFGKKNMPGLPSADFFGAGPRFGTGRLQRLHRPTAV